MSHYAHTLTASARFLEHRQGAMSRLLRTVILALRIRAERNRLARLSDDALRDMGLARADVVRESERSLLDIPEHRKSTLYL